MAIFTLNYLQESKQKYDSKIIDRAADVFRKLQKILSNSNNAFFTLYPIRQDKISFKKKDNNNLVASYSIGKVNNEKDYEEDIRKIITDARYIINGTTRDCRVTLYAQVDSNIYSTITFFNCANKYILSEASKYNTSQYLEDDNIERPSKIIKHLSNSEIRRCRDIIKSCINKYPRIKKCCDYIDLYDNEEFDDEGERSSALDRYKSRKGSSYLRLVEGDVYSGYPDFKEEGSEVFHDDVSDLKEDVNEKFKSFNIPAEFMVKLDYDAINFGIISKKT